MRSPKTPVRCFAPWMDTSRVRCSRGQRLLAAVTGQDLEEDAAGPEASTGSRPPPATVARRFGRL